MIDAKNKIPSTQQAWLEEIAKAYCNAYETLPFGKFVGQEINPADLFHLGPAICLKFRGIKNTKRNLEKATETALTSYMATKEIVPDLFDIPQMSFAFSYIASHYGLDLVDEKLSAKLLDYIENNLKRLLDLTHRKREIQN
jgi:hypothetical protein